MIDDESLKSIENLHRLKNEGVITEEEFEKAKQRLLFDTRRAQAVPTQPFAVLASHTGTLPAADDHLGWITLPLRRYADFTGRSTRKEYWMFQLIPAALCVLGVVVVGGSTDDYGETSTLGNFSLGLILIAILGLIVPQLAVQVRRLHDQDRSGWIAAINLIPYIGVLVTLVFMFIEGTKGDNRFGPDPLSQ